MSAVTVAAVATVASAGVAAYSAYDQKKKAGEAADQANAANKDLYGSKVDPDKYDDRIGTDKSYARQLPSEVESYVDNSLPGVFDVADQVNRRNRLKREKASGGTFTETQQQEGANILAMEKGQIPQDVIDSVNRIIAENLGGAFDPSGGLGFGTSAVSNDAARKLGLTSLDIMSKGMSFAPSWRSNVDSFVYKPQQAQKDFFDPATGAVMNAEQLQMKRDEAEYISANNIAKATAMPDPGTVGSFRDSLALGAIENKADQNLGNAFVGLANGGAATYNSFKTNNTAGTYNSSPAPYTANSGWRANATNRGPRV